MARSDSSAGSGSAPRTDIRREPRPFLYLEPAQVGAVDPVGSDGLARALEPRVPHVVRGLVDFTIARHNARAARPRPIQLSVLNRRRRAARLWTLAIARGDAAASTCRQVATHWLPLLCAVGPDRSGLADAVRSLVEYVRGAVTALVFDEPSDSLASQARALHALEATLSAHLGAALEHARATEAWSDPPSAPKATSPKKPA